LRIFLYNLLLIAAAALAVPYSVLRGMVKGDPRRAVRERLGSLPAIPQQTAFDSIWLHAVSVGEVLSCIELVKALRRRLPQARIFVSTTTATGQQMAVEKLSGLASGVFFAPLDLLFSVRNVLRRLRPRLVIVAETEIWPNLFRETKRMGSALLLVNGRISDKSAPRYRFFRFFFTAVLRYPDRILAQSAIDRERFLAAGAPQEKVRAGGNLKYEFQPAGVQLAAEFERFLSAVSPQPLVVAGSTREGEEQLVLEAFRQVAARHDRALLVVAPRHPQRFQEVAELLASSGVPFARRSEWRQARHSLNEFETFPLPGVLLLDSLGELSALYARADVVFVGGSLNGWGGHNVLEPAFYGKPVVVGSCMQNFRAIADELLAVDAMVQIQQASELGEALLALIDAPQRAGAMGARARKVAESQRGAAERAAEEAQRLYDEALCEEPTAGIARLLLGGPALVWEAAARLREAAYRRGWLPRKRLGIPTLCVGNLTAGGAGKTPFVAWLAGQLALGGHNPGILTRGYRRSSGPRSLVIQRGRERSPQETGDEAQVLLRQISSVGDGMPVGIGAHRYEAGRLLLAGSAVDLVVLDDGFQHLQLERDLDLVLVDVTRPFGGGAMLPLGRLREPLSALRRAHAIVLTRTEPSRRYEALERRLRTYHPHAPIFRSRFEATSLVEAASGRERTFHDLRGARAVAFCGVGNPDSFWRLLEDEGLAPARRFVFRDHHRYAKSDVDKILNAAREEQAALVVTTEKDIVNLARAAGSSAATISELDPRAARLFHPYELYWVRIRVVIEEEERFLDWLRQRLGGVPGAARDQTLSAKPVAQRA
jgi:tetraacyldisaccharide 4'-kinase